LPNLSIEHIGSTAVPGLKSKHMIDLLVIVSNQNLQVVKKSLIGLGFHERDIWIDTEEKPYVGGSLVLGNKPKITHIPDWVRVAILKLVRLLAGSKIYGPVEFFMTVMAMDMVAPEYGKHTLKEHFTNLNKAYA
jgi:hypothetical protein